MSSPMPALAGKPSKPATHVRCSLHRSALSLRPDATVMDAYIAGNGFAQAIVECWRFKFPIRTVTPEQFAEMMYNRAVFIG